LRHPDVYQRYALAPRLEWTVPSPYALGLGEELVVDHAEGTYSITSSVRASNVDDTVMPSNFSVVCSRNARAWPRRPIFCINADVLVLRRERPWLSDQVRHIYLGRRSSHLLLAPAAMTSWSWKRTSIHIWRWHFSMCTGLSRLRADVRT